MSGLEYLVYLFAGLGLLYLVVSGLPYVVSIIRRHAAARLSASVDHAESAHARSQRILDEMSIDPSLDVPDPADTMPLHLQGLTLEEVMKHLAEEDDTPAASPDPPPVTATAAAGDAVNLPSSATRSLFTPPPSNRPGEWGPAIHASAPAAPEDTPCANSAAAGATEWAESQYRIAVVIREHEVETLSDESAPAAAEAEQTTAPSASEADAPAASIDPVPPASAEPAVPLSVTLERLLHTDTLPDDIEIVIIRKRDLPTQPMAAVDVEDDLEAFFGTTKPVRLPEGHGAVDGSSAPPATAASLRHPMYDEGVGERLVRYRVPQPHSSSPQASGTSTDLYQHAESGQALLASGGVATCIHEDAWMPKPTGEQPNMQFVNHALPGMPSTVRDENGATTHPKLQTDCANEENDLLTWYHMAS